MACGKYMTPQEISAYAPYTLTDDGLTPNDRARKRMEDGGLWTEKQYMGRRWGIGCVSLEITQRWAVRSRALRWGLRMSGRESSIRMERQPRLGFSSLPQSK